MRQEVANVWQGILRVNHSDGSGRKKGMKKTVERGRLNMSTLGKGHVAKRRRGSQLSQETGRSVRADRSIMCNRRSP